MRVDGRLPNELRPISLITGYTRWAEGSVLAQFGETHVLCNVTVEERLPRWLHQQSGEARHGWLSAEYALLPRSTHQRSQREQQWPKGRTQEISRLIGRSLRMGLNLAQLGERQLIVDCDVLQADGGTRTAAITGGWLAVQLALRPLIAAGIVSPKVLRRQIAAVSVGVVAGQPMLDLAYVEDVSAETDLNVVMAPGGAMVEIQGTAEKVPFNRDQLAALLDLAAAGIEQLFQHQQQTPAG